MATYCGTADCILVSRDWSDLTVSGTLTYAADYITAASEWVDAKINDWHVPISPLTAGGTEYDYWIKRAASNYAVWMAYDSVMRDKYEAGAEPYWNTYRTTAEDIMADLRKRWSTMTEDPSQWERGIAPARGVLNGTISAPYIGVMLSNASYGGVYTGNMDRTMKVVLDGSGSTIYEQTFSWGYKGGTAYNQTKLTIQPDVWQGLDYGVAICFPVQADGTLETGQTWEIQCIPARGGNYQGKGLHSWDINLG